jgi:hypothetical protein
VKEKASSRSKRTWKILVGETKVKDCYKQGPRLVETKEWNGKKRDETKGNAERKERNKEDIPRQ